MQRIGSFFGRAGLAGFVMMIAAGAPALAGCYEEVGCTDSDRMDVGDLVGLSCQNLWHLRNSIYDENGFCFKTRRARRAFDNSDCYVDDQGDVELSRIERYNVNQIVQAEEENGCN